MSGWEVHVSEAGREVTQRSVGEMSEVHKHMRQRGRVAHDVPELLVDELHGQQDVRRLCTEREDEAQDVVRHAEQVHSTGHALRWRFSEVPHGPGFFSFF